MDERTKLYASKVLPDATVSFYVDPAGEEGGPRGTWIGPFETVDEARAKQFELYGLDPAELDDLEDRLDPMNDPAFPLLWWTYRAGVREVVSLERVVGRVLRDLLDDLGGDLEEDLRERLGWQEEEPDVTWRPTLPEDAVRRVAVRLATALRDEGVDVPDLPVTWTE